MYWVSVFGPTVYGKPPFMVAASAWDFCTEGFGPRVAQNVIATVGGGNLAPP